VSLLVVHGTDRGDWMAVAGCRSSGRILTRVPEPALTCVAKAALLVFALGEGLMEVRNACGIELMRKAISPGSCCNSSESRNRPRHCEPNPLLALKWKHQPPTMCASIMRRGHGFP
jgi:hypothetical protein